MVLYDIVRALERVESGQKKILERLDALGKRGADGPDGWLQAGIDSIMNYQAGKNWEEKR